MATGYTYPVKEGEVDDFAEFTMQCARAFGALIMLRDAPGAPVPDEVKPDNEYNERTLATYRARIVEIDGWTPAQAEAARDAAHDDAVNRRAEMAAQARIETERYEAMLAKVEAWTPPTSEHNGLKVFMTEQLTDSIRFDGFELPAPDLLSVAEYVARERSQAVRMAGIYETHVAEEIERATARTAWIRALRASLES